MRLLDTRGVMVKAKVFHDVFKALPFTISMFLRESQGANPAHHLDP